jgi:hypothetical protein
LSSRETLSEGLVLGLARPIDEKPAEQPCTRPSGRTEPSIPADGTGNGTDTSARSGAGQCTLLGRSHIGASSSEHSGSHKQQ